MYDFTVEVVPPSRIRALLKMETQEQRDGPSWHADGKRSQSAGLTPTLSSGDAIESLTPSLTLQHLLWKLKKKNETLCE